jgi:hypothetical protein
MKNYVPKNVTVEPSDIPTKSLTSPEKLYSIESVINTKVCFTFTAADITDIIDRTTDAAIRFNQSKNKNSA